MEYFGDIQKKYGTRALSTAVMLGFVLVLTGRAPLAKGLVLGTLFSILNFVFMAFSLGSRLDVSARKASAKALGSIFFRFAFMAIPLYIAITHERFDLYATITGLFFIQLMILADHLYRLFRKKQDPAAPGQKEQGACGR